MAERRVAGTAPSEPPRTRVVAAAVIAVFGVLIGVAAVQNSRNEAVEDAGRATLIARIEEARSDLEDRQAQIADLTRENRTLADELTDLNADRQQAESQLRRLQLSTGYLPATGEGVRIVVDGNPIGDAIQQVTDADLAMLVDGLWEAGAEAIAINDQRLNPLGSIRNIGSAIHVNTVPLTPPYVVRAIGDDGPCRPTCSTPPTARSSSRWPTSWDSSTAWTMWTSWSCRLPGSGPLSHVESGTADQRGGGGVEEGQP